MVRLFANANYDFIGVRRYAYAVTAVLLAVGLRSPCWCGGSTTASSSPAAPWSRSRPRRRWTSARSAPGSRRQGIRGAEIQPVRQRPGVRRSGPGPPRRAPTPTTPRRPRQAVDQRARPGAGGRDLHRSARTEAVGPKVGGELRQKALLAILLVVRRGADLPGLPVRVAVRPGGRDRHRARHPHHARVHRRDQARGEPGGGRRGPVHGRLLAERHDHHLRPGPREPAEDARA